MKDRPRIEELSDIGSSIRTYDVGRMHEVATRLFLEKGFFAVSLKDIAFAADIPVGSMHKLTGGKERLLFQLIEGYEIGLQEAASVRVKCARTAMTELDAFVTAYVEYGVSARQRHYLANQELLALPESSKATLRSLRDKRVNDLWRIIAHGHATKSFDCPELRFTAKIILASLEGILSNRTVGSDELQQSVELLKRMANRFVIAFNETM
ncbi:TetR/AcrR family transcriptional regulator [Pseudomonas savastanoi]|uniref:TetR/AcrR family transcriptional regulator n=1 Tax=Pseudomonas savastanoi TaxID=29438 RepID=A0AAW5JDW4_PSESS|nr:MULTISPECIES: TetR family transcriptional regulator [Pseudomonas]MBP1143178.1 AcrR family transcriptional regulator [Pseudomonas sp. PvP027]MCQ3023905.1 TetR/AcrR family transcriptional regulator [Pseudomonas savastanoi]